MVNEENEKTIIRTSRLIDKANNKLFEQVLGGVYVTYDKTNNIVKKVSQVETSKFVFIPIDNKTTKAKAIKLPLNVNEYGRTSNLLKEIENHIYKYLDVSNQFRKLSSWFILMSWIPDNLNTVNYLRALGDWGSGKSRFFNIVGGLCYKPIPMAGAINPAPLYRLMDMWKGTMLLDECVLNKSDESSYIVQILNAGIERYKYVWRCDTEDVKDKYSIEN